MTKLKTKSPLRHAPLPLPGQSIDKQIDDVLYDGALAPMMLALFMLMLAALEWFRYYSNAKPNPIIYSAGALLVVVYAAWRVVRTRTKVRQLRLGRDGERAVAQYLERFRARGFSIFHDIPNGDSNIDHVLIGPRGLFTIETKTLSKPERGECKVTFNGDHLVVNGKTPDRNALIQAKAQARWLHTLLADAQFKSFVQPVVVFPGWFVEPFDMRQVGVWVLEPKGLEPFIDGQNERHSPDEVRAMASCLSSYLRSQSKL